MAASGQQNDEKDYSSFLLDGLIPSPSPLVLLVTDSASAMTVATQLHAGLVDWDELPAATGRLISFATDAAAELTSPKARELCEELVATGHWLYIGDVDTLLDSVGGKYLLDALLKGIASGELPTVITATRLDLVSRLRSRAIRFMGFAVTVEGPDAAGEFEFSHSTSVVRPAHDRNDTGWVVAVRLQLSSPISPEADPETEAAAAGVMELVDTAQLVDWPDRPPAGVMIGLRPDAFTVGQETAAFATAAKAARRVVGRPLLAGESVTAARGIYYA
jgi:hypothetical protein